MRYYICYNPTFGPRLSSLSCFRDDQFFIYPDQFIISVCYGFSAVYTGSLSRLNLRLADQVFLDHLAEYSHRYPGDYLFRLDSLRSFILRIEGL